MNNNSDKLFKFDISKFTYCIKFLTDIIFEYHSLYYNSIKNVFILKNHFLKNLIQTVCISN